MSPEDQQALIIKIQQWLALLPDDKARKEAISNVCSYCGSDTTDGACYCMRDD